MISAVCAMLGVAAFAQIPTYQVYDLKFSAKTTAAKGVTTLTTACGEGDEYCYREKSSVVIKGVLGGCGCGAILANGTCLNAALWLWDDTRKLVITNVTSDTGWRVQVIGKKQNVVEHFTRLTGTYGDNDEYEFDITLCGFGSNKIDKNDPYYNYVPSITGYFAGWISAPYYYKAGSCNVCGVTALPYFSQSVALAMCSCAESEGETDPCFTPFGGTYTVKYNSTKSKNVSKGNLSQKTLGLPSYVDLTDVAATNINIEE